MSDIPATYIYAPEFHVAVQEYYETKPPRLLIRAAGNGGLSMGFDLSPDDALKFAQALTKHANSMKEKAGQAC
jgi:hypothetical protein